MRQITSVQRAIQYFEDGSRVKSSRNSKGEVYDVIVPPMSFLYMLVTIGGITFRFDSFQWLHYAIALKEHKEAITKLVLYYE